MKYFRIYVSKEIGVWVYRRAKGGELEMLTGECTWKPDRLRICHTREAHFDDENGVGVLAMLEDLVCLKDEHSLREFVVSI